MLGGQTLAALNGSSCAVAIAPRGYGMAEPEVRTVGVGDAGTAEAFPPSRVKVRPTLMTSGARGATLGHMTPAAYPTIRIDHESHGDWEVELPDEVSPVRCRTLHEARRLAYRHAHQGQPCELVICDAYHRVAHRELVNAG
jgi:hypothetical protein